MKRMTGLAAVALLLSVVTISGMGSSVRAEAAVNKNLNKTKATLYTGNTLNLKVKKAKSVQWKSSNKKVATVKKGKVTALAKGKATITAKVGNTKLKCSITVKSNYLNRKTVTLYRTSTFQLNVVKFKGKLKGWSSGNKSVVSVSNTGLIKGVAKGSTTVTVKLKRETYRCKVKVVNALSRKDFHMEIKDKQGNVYTNFIDYAEFWGEDTDYISVAKGVKVERGIRLGSSRDQVAAAYGETKKRGVTYNYEVDTAPAKGVDLTGAAYYYDYVYYESGVKYELRFYFDYFDKVTMLLLGKGLF